MSTNKETKTTIQFTLQDVIDFEPMTPDYTLSNSCILETIRSSLKKLLNEDLNVLAKKLKLKIKEDNTELKHECNNCSDKERFLRKKASNNNTLKEVPELIEKLLNKKSFNSPKPNLINNIKNENLNSGNKNMRKMTNELLDHYNSPLTMITLTPEVEDSHEITAPSFLNNYNNYDNFDLKSNLDILLCDSFKSSYEASLYETTDLTEINQADNFQNYKLLVLYGNISFSINSYEKAINFYEMAINLLYNNDKPSVNGKIQIAVLLNNISKCLINLLRISEGIEKLHCALDILKNLKENSTAFSLLVTLNLNLSDAYYNVEDYEHSLNLLEELFIKLKDSEGILDLNDKDKFLFKYFKNVGKISYRLNNFKYALKNFESSLLFLEKADSNNKVELSDVYNYIGLNYLSLKETEKASVYLENAYLMFKSMYGESHVKTLMVSLNLVKLYKSDKEGIKALQILDNAINIGSKNKEVSEIYLAVLHRVLGTYYFELGNEVKGLMNFSKANTIHKNYINISKTPINEINSMIHNMHGVVVV